MSIRQKQRNFLIWKGLGVMSRFATIGMLLVFGLFCRQCGDRTSRQQGSGHKSSSHHSVAATRTSLTAIRITATRTTPAKITATRGIAIRAIAATVTATTTARSRFNTIRVAFRRDKAPREPPKTRIRRLRRGTRFTRSGHQTKRPCGAASKTLDGRPGGGPKGRPGSLRSNGKPGRLEASRPGFFVAASQRRCSCSVGFSQLRDRLENSVD